MMRKTEPFFGTAPIVGWPRGRLPQLVHNRAALGAAEHMRRRAIDNEDRPSVFIVAGHDAADCPARRHGAGALIRLMWASP